MTNLNLETAEQLQVSYYESGGHYKPHYDFDINEVSSRPKYSI